MNKMHAGITTAFSTERLPVKVGLGMLDKQMTSDEARRWGNRNIPGDLKRAGFEVCLFRSDPEINGGNFFRVSYGKSVGRNGVATS